MNPVIIGDATLWLGDCMDVLRTLGNASVDSICTDPPYHLTQVSRGGHARTNNPGMPHGRHRIGDKGFMGKVWDGGDIAHRVEMWSECLRVLKPGGHLLAFAGSRTYHRMTCAIEDAGFEVRDQIMWIYGSGFPKSRNLDGDWKGWGSALKPSHEPICMARRPLISTVAANVEAHGTGAINIDACRVGGESTARRNSAEMGYHGGNLAAEYVTGSDTGRWPANVIHDGSPEVLESFEQFGERGGQDKRTWLDQGTRPSGFGNVGNDKGDSLPNGRLYGDTGSAARFFYCAKASRADRNEGANDLMRLRSDLTGEQLAYVMSELAAAGVEP